MTLGGAERVLVDVANKLCDMYDITIFSIYSKGEMQKQLRPEVKFKSMYDCRYDELSHIKKKLIPFKVLLLSRYIYKKYIKENYDVEISFLEGPITRLFCIKNKNVKKIAWIHNDISLVFGNGLKAKIKKFIDKKVYKKYDDLVFVSKDNLNNFKELYKNISPDRIHLIYNYIDENKVIEKAMNDDIDTNIDYSMVNFVSVCRLVPQKGIDRLIEVHSKLIQEGYMHNFYIVGDGPEKDKLIHMVKEKNITETFKILGAKENPYPYIKAADYFCLFSYFEGYGMVLEEAKILNKKIIITDTAARECLANYPNGIIVDNSDEAIFNGIKNVLDNPKNKEGAEIYQYNNTNEIKKIINLVGD